MQKSLHSEICMVFSTHISMCYYTVCVCVHVCVRAFAVSHVCSVISLSQLSGVEKVGTQVCLPLVPVPRLGVLQAHLKVCVCVCAPCDWCVTPRNWPSGRQCL